MRQKQFLHWLVTLTWPFTLWPQTALYQSLMTYVTSPLTYIFIRQRWAWQIDVN